MHVYTRREPVGVAGQIIPWNFPLLMAAWKLGPALAAGCTVVLKPAEQTPLSALRLGELALEVGFPPGVLNILTGDGETGAALVEHPDVDKIAFTGSTAVGREIGAKAGRALKRVTLELGGKSPNIILPDADIEAAVKGSFQAIYFNSGQACNAGSRLFVPADRYDEVVSALAEAAAATQLGPGLDGATQLGPLVSAEQQERVLCYIASGRDEGAEVVTGGDAALTDSGGYYVAPTLFSTTSDDLRIAREEIFGPVLVASPYDTPRGGRRARQRGRVRARGGRLDARRRQRPQDGRDAARRHGLREHVGRSPTRRLRSGASRPRGSGASTATTASTPTSRARRSGRRSERRLSERRRRKRAAAGPAPPRAMGAGAGCPVRAARPRRDRRGGPRRRGRTLAADPEAAARSPAGCRGSASGSASASS